MLRGAVEELETGESDSDYNNSWISWFLSTKGNEYFCEVEEEYILDRFNLTGLNTEVQNYAQALDLITDNLDDDIQEEFRGSLDVQARLLYGLIHARWIVTVRGLSKMLEKYKKADFGRCPRVLCQSQPLLPVGLTDVPFEKSVKLYCGRCEDIYSPKSSRHGSIDGAYFGTSFPHMFFLAYPHLIPSKGGASVDSGLGGMSGLGSAGTTGGVAGSLGGSVAGGVVAEKRRRRDGTDDAMDGTGGVGAAAGLTATALGGVHGTDDASTTTAALKAERYRPRIFGFQVHEIAKLQRWQEAVRDQQIARMDGHHYL